jgi:zinc transporter 1/2/3
MPLRIASIFIILVASLLGALSPVLLSRADKMHVPRKTFFVFKYVGTGVIIGTAWMHLLAPAAESLGDPCLEYRLGEYDWAFAIGLMTVMVMFLVEMLASRFERGPSAPNRHHDSGSASDKTRSLDTASSGTRRPCGAPTRMSTRLCPHEADVERMPGAFNPPGPPDDLSYPPGGEDHLAHARDHAEGDSHAALAGQLTAIFILEFGVVFHSIFIGLVLATASNLNILLVVLTFHQLFEGLGLGSRLATANWTHKQRWWPYLLGTLFGVSTPVAIAVGLAAKPSNAETQLLVNGIFDAISAGILMYTGLVELLAHEFMFNPHMRNSPMSTQLVAFGCVAIGAGVMAVLAKWA